MLNKNFSITNMIYKLSLRVKQLEKNDKFVRDFPCMGHIDQSLLPQSPAIRDSTSPQLINANIVHESKRNRTED
jgi:hypothetical protein